MRHYNRKFCSLPGPGRYIYICSAGTASEPVADNIPSASRQVVATYSQRSVPEIFLIDRSNQ